MDYYLDLHNKRRVWRTGRTPYSVRTGRDRRKECEYPVLRQHGIVDGVNPGNSTITEQSLGLKKMLWYGVGELSPSNDGSRGLVQNFP